MAWHNNEIMANCIINPKILAAAATMLVERRQGFLQRMLKLRVVTYIYRPITASQIQIKNNNSKYSSGKVQ